MVKFYKRAKRASAEQLYKTCKQAGTCPPDVIPKIEQTTIADQILKYGSTAVFFGGLGIGTGSGGGGSTGYVPIRGGAGSSVSVGPRIPIRPPQVVEDVITIGPGDSSVIGVEVTPPLQPVDVEIIAEGGGVPDIPSSADTFNVVTSPDTTVVTTQPPTVSTPARGASNATGSGRSQTTHHFNNPVFEAATPRGSGVGESSFSPHTTIVAGSSSMHGESIPMVEFPTSSTPLQSVTRGATALNRYSAYTRQVPIADPALYSRPTDLLSIRNPLFDIDPFNVSDTLETDPASIPTPPDERFLDIYKLHRPAMSRAKGGRVRFSRIGFTRGTVSTRAGTNIGGRVHFYHDLSSILPIAEEIELQPLTISSGSSDLVNVDFSTETGFTGDPIMSYYDPDTDLDLPFEETESYQHSFVRPTGGGSSISSPSISSPSSFHPVQSSKGTHALMPVVPGLPTTPHAGVYVSVDFWLHPGLLSRRKRRFPFLFTDGIVAA
ncbi:L2 [Ursus maritimus papillomavirus 1]|uniref:Minor capsid protein L2 n=1 Tax=Ursus maritimus papillomavirus 1 TaxID=461322 RepID=B2KKX0_9PAPI|nr:L2 [Ursus maritimus papillomavirus 1]ABV80248.1 L2 [Ursus maritimus papillomavirus 1]